MTENTTAPAATAAPEDFDLDTWLEETTSPEAGCIVYGKGDLAGEAQILVERITNLRANMAADPEPGLSERSELRKLEDRLRTVDAEFRASALELRFRALGHEESLAFNKELRIRSRTVEMTPHELGYRRMHAALVSPAIGDFTKFHKLMEKIGPVQSDAAANACSRAQAVSPTVDADFLQRASEPAAS